MKVIDDKAVLEVSNDIIKGEMDGEIIMLSISKGAYYTLNATGTFIYRILAEGPLSLKAVLERIAAHFGISEECAKVDTLPFIDRMLEKEILLIER